MMAVTWWYSVMIVIILGIKSKWINKINDIDKGNIYNDKGIGNINGNDSD